MKHSQCSDVRTYANIQVLLHKYSQDSGCWTLGAQCPGPERPGSRGAGITERPGCLMSLDMKHLDPGALELKSRAPNALVGPKKRDKIFIRFL